jgi:hypothetical protein
MADKNKSKRERFSPLFLANIKALWQSGMFRSVDDFKKYGDGIYKKFPSCSFLNHKMAEENWDKNKTAEEIEARAEASYSELFENEGVGDVETVKRICLGIKAPERTVKAIVDYATANGGHIDDDALEKFATAMNYDLRTANDYIIERNKMVGAYAASKHKLSGRVSVTDLRNMTMEEAAAEHERIHNNFVSSGLCKKP